MPEIIEPLTHEQVLLVVDFLRNWENDYRAVYGERAGPSTCRFISQVATWVNSSRRMLTPAQAVAIWNVMTQLQVVAVQSVIPNGDYILRVMEEDNTVRRTVFKIYTGTRGDMRGKRMIKIEDGFGPDGFKAVAFLNANDTVTVWRRYRDDERVRDLIARITPVLEILRNTSESLIGRELSLFTLIPPHPTTNEPVEVSVTRTHRCELCNGFLVREEQGARFCNGCSSRLVREFNPVTVVDTGDVDVQVQVGRNVPSGPDYSTSQPLTQSGDNANPALFPTQYAPGLVRSDINSRKVR